MKCPRCQHEAAAGTPVCPRCGSALPDDSPLSLGQQPTFGREPAPPSVGDLPTLRAARRWKVGDKLSRRYRVLGELGQGGMGIVYRCLDEVGGIEIALKALPPELSHNSGEMEEVRENFRLVERLYHPHVAAVKTLEQDAGSGNFYLILELAEGVDLRRWRKQRGGRVPLAEALPVLRQVAAALDFAHSRKIIHRDIKPGNIMVSADGTVKVLDFGLAAQIQSSLSRVSQVHFSTSGTGPYMAPEQWRGQRQDGAADQYALAVVAYELLAGHLPFEVQEAAILREAVLQDTAAPVAGLAGGAAAALARGLAKGAAERFGSCAEFVEALEKPEIRNPKSEENPKSEIRNPQAKLRWGLAAVGLLLLLLAGGWYFGVRLPEQKRQADLARLEAEARAANDAKEKARLTAEAEQLRTAREKQQAADKLKAEAAQRERDRLANAKGGLLVKTAPSGATVTLGGEDVQPSPATFKGVKIGKYPLRVSLDRYEPLSREVEIKENEFDDLGTLTLTRSTGSLKLTSEPAGADYELTGADTAKKTGQTPADLTSLPTGDYRYSVKRGDWEQTGTVTVRGQETAAAQVEFAYGSVSLSSEPSGATVAAGGKELGRTPLALKDLRPGAVSYRMSLDGFKAADVSGSLVAREALKLAATLEKVPYLTLDQPWENSLGMKFVPVAGTKVLFGVWDVRVKDFAVFAGDSAGNGGWDYRKGAEPYVLKSGEWKQRGWDYGWNNPGFAQTGEHPVVCVSWEDATNFCAWLTRKERAEGKLSGSQSYRLPKDWEWSVAVGLNEAQAGTPKEKDGKIEGVYPWGTTWPPPVWAGNYAGSEAKDADWPSSWATIEGYQDGYARTSPVGNFQPNRFGLYDLGGNVWQWCEDFYDGQNGSRVLRGASWGDGDPRGVLASSRDYNTPGTRIYNVGFRVVLVGGASR